MALKTSAVCKFIFTLSFLARIGSAYADSSSLKLTTDDGRLSIKSNISDLITPQVKESLGAGFTSILNLDFALMSEGQVLQRFKPVSIELRYDVWDERYRMIVTQGKTKRRKRFSQLEEALLLLKRLPPFDLADLNEIPEMTPLSIHLNATLFPAGEEEIESVREWIHRPMGSEPGSRWMGALVGALIDEKSAFQISQRSLFSASFKRIGTEIHEAH